MPRQRRVYVPLFDDKEQEEKFKKALEEGKKEAERLLKDVKDGKICDCEAMARLADFLYSHISGIKGDKNRKLATLEALTRILAGRTGSKSVRDETYAVGISVGRNSFGTGCFKREYAEEGSNQVQHFIGWVAAGWYWPDWMARLALYDAEHLSSDEGENSTDADVLLGKKAIEFGDQFEVCTIKRRDIGKWIRENICK